MSDETAAPIAPAAFDPHNWFWIIAESGERWSSAVAGYVSESPADRTTPIASVAQLDDVLRFYGLRSPIISADDVRAECARRLCAVFGARDSADLAVKISNASREAIRLLRIKSTRAWTKKEAMRAAQLEGADMLVEAMRATSNALEEKPPADYTDNAYWPGA